MSLQNEVFDKLKVMKTAEKDELITSICLIVDAHKDDHKTAIERIGEEIDKYLVNR